MTLRAEMPDERVRPESPTRSLAGRDVAVVAVYLLCGCWLWRGLLPHLATHAPYGGLRDPGLFIWWMNWTPWAVLHGHDPFFTTYLNAPTGVSGLWNTSVPALGVLFAPVTLAFGAVASFNLACILGPPLSATAGYLWLRRHSRRAGAFIGGLTFGFSPLVIGQAREGHLMMTWLVLVPVVVMLIEDVLWRSQTPVRSAWWLGLVVTIQLLIGTEVLLILGIGCVGLAVALFLEDPRRTRARRGPLVRALGVAFAVGAALCAVPVYEMFGRARVPTHGVHRIGKYGGGFRSLTIAPASMMFHGARPALGHLTTVEDALYVGVPLLVLLAVTVVAGFRRRGVWIATAALAAGAVFSIHGAHWNVGGIAIPLPTHVLQRHVPLTENIVTPRFMLLGWLAIAWLLAVFVDRAATRLFAGSPRIPLAIAGACLIPLVPGPLPPTPAVATTPAFFTSAVRRRWIPTGSVVMVAPLAGVSDDAAQLWQIDSGMHFRQLGGYAVRAAPNDGHATFLPDARALGTLFTVDARTEQPYRGALTAALLTEARRELRTTGTRDLIVGPSPYAEPRQLAIARALVGRAPDRVDGDVSIWRLDPAAP